MFNEATAVAVRNFNRDICSSSSFLYLDVPISMIENDRKRIRFRGQTVAPNSGESSSGLVSYRVPRLSGFFMSRSTRISVACKLHFITRYRWPRLHDELIGPIFRSAPNSRSSSCIFRGRAVPSLQRFILHRIDRSFGRLS